LWIAVAVAVVVVLSVAVVVSLVVYAPETARTATNVLVGRPQSSS
jgi:hypothetical protein